MYVHTRERDSRPGFDGVKIKLLLYYYYYCRAYCLHCPVGLAVRPSRPDPPGEPESGDVDVLQAARAHPPGSHAVAV